MRNPYRRLGDRPPAHCVARGLDRDSIDRIASRKGEPVRAGDLNPWKGCLRSIRVGDHVRQHDTVSPIARALIAFGGASALTRTPFGGLSEREARDLAEHGQLWPASGLRMAPGTVSRCHDNACQLWAARQDALILATGFCLDADGLWRQHSWCIDVSGDKPGVVETTSRRLLYFGVALDAEASLEMCRSQLDWTPRLARAPIRDPGQDTDPTPGAAP